MTEAELVKKRQELVHHMFSSTGDEFVRIVLENCRGGGSALSAEMAERMNAEEFDWNGFQWFKFHIGEPRGKTRKILLFPVLQKRKILIVPASELLFRNTFRIRHMGDQKIYQFFF